MLVFKMGDGGIDSNVHLHAPFYTAVTKLRVKNKLSVFLNKYFIYVPRASVIYFTAQYAAAMPCTQARYG